MTTDRGALAHLRHELRTPLNHIIGYTEMLVEDAGYPEHKAALQGILTDAQMLLGLINEFLAPTFEDGGVDMAGLSIRLDLPLTGVIAACRVIKSQIAESDEARADIDRIATAAEHLSDLVRSGLAERVAERNAAIPLPKVPTDATQARVTVSGTILIVDDNGENREMLGRRLIREGYEVRSAAGGTEALACLEMAVVDLVLLDVMMPDINGYEVLKRLKANPQLSDIPVLMISSLEDTHGIARCIELGADDYLPKPFNPVILRARVGACLEKKHLRDRDRRHVTQLQAEKERLQQTQKRLEDELQEAANYVVSLLPPPMETPLRISWAYLPSTELGGDSFGYHWIDENHLAIYLLDVCGHGVGAALHSVAALNVIRSGVLPGTDYRDAGMVLAGLNEAFQMDRHNDMYFTLWYGVYHTTTRNLSYASGGHPPAVMLKPTANGLDAVEQLSGEGFLIGGLPGESYLTKTTTVSPGSRLFVYCDGAFEIMLADQTMLDFETAFIPRLCEAGRSNTAPDDLLAWARSLNVGPVLADDFSVMVIDFPEE